MSKYTADQILTATQTDLGLARYYISTLDEDTMRAYLFDLAQRVPIPLTHPLDPAHAIEQAVMIAARLLGTTPNEVMSTSRKQAPLEARQIVCYAARLLGMSYETIGRHVWRDHSTVMNSVVRVGETPRLRRIANGIAGELGWDRTTEAAS